MAFTDLGSLGATGSSADNQTSIVLTTTAAAAVGELVVIVVADDNRLSTADADGLEVSSCTDNSAGGPNIWRKGAGWANNNAGTQAGAACQIWWSVLRTAIANGGTITATPASNTLSDASAISARHFSFSGGGYIAVEATNGGATDAADPASLDATTSNIECLRIRGIAGEVGTATGLTVTSTWTDWEDGNSATSGTTAEMCVRAEHIIATGTGAASNPTWVSCDNASAYVAFRVSSTYDIGLTQIFATDDGGANNGNIIAQPIVVSESNLVIQSLSIYVLTAVGQLRLGLYDNAGGGTPAGGAKIAECAEVTPGTGWQTVAVATPVSCPVGTYYLAFEVNNTGLHLRRQSIGVTKYFKAQTYGALPSPFPAAPTTSVNDVSLYATFSQVVNVTAEAAVGTGVARAVTTPSDSSFTAAAAAGTGVARAVSVQLGANVSVNCPAVSGMGVARAISATRAYVKAITLLGTLRNNSTCLAGFKFTVGSQSLQVRALGRWVVAGNTQSHTLYLRRVSDDVDMASVALATSGATAGAFKYASLSSPVVLAANTAYYAYSEETFLGDQWYNDDNTQISAETSDATLNGADIFDYTNHFTAVAPWVAGPVDFLFAPSTADVSVGVSASVGTGVARTTTIQSDYAATAQIVSATGVARAVVTQSDCAVAAQVASGTGVARASGISIDRSISAPIAVGSGVARDLGYGLSVPAASATAMNNIGLEGLAVSVALPSASASSSATALGVETNMDLGIGASPVAAVGAARSLETGITKGIPAASATTTARSVVGGASVGAVGVAATGIGRALATIETETASSAVAIGAAGNASASLAVVVPSATGTGVSRATVIVTGVTASITPAVASSLARALAVEIRVQTAVASGASVARAVAAGTAGTVELTPAVAIGAVGNVSCAISASIAVVSALGVAGNVGIQAGSNAMVHPNAATGIGVAASGVSSIQITSGTSVGTGVAREAGRQTGSQIAAVTANGVARAVLESVSLGLAPAVGVGVARSAARELSLMMPPAIGIGVVREIVSRAEAVIGAGTGVGVSTVLRGSVETFGARAVGTGVARDVEFGAFTSVGLSPAAGIGVARGLAVFSRDIIIGSAIANGIVAGASFEIGAEVSRAETSVFVSSLSVLVEASLSRVEATAALGAISLERDVQIPVLAARADGLAAGLNSDLRIDVTGSGAAASVNDVFTQFGPSFVVGRTTGTGIARALFPLPRGRHPSLRVEARPARQRVHAAAIVHKTGGDKHAASN